MAKKHHFYFDVEIKNEKWKIKILFFCKRKSISCESTFESPNKQQRRPGLWREWAIKTFLLILAALLTIVCFLLKNKKAIWSTRAQKVAVFLSGRAKSVCVHACSSLWWGVMHFVCVCVSGENTHSKYRFLIFLHSYSAQGIQCAFCNSAVHLHKTQPSALPNEFDVLRRKPESIFTGWGRSFLLAKLALPEEFTCA